MHPVGLWSSHSQILWILSRSIPANYYKQSAENVHLPISFLATGFHVGEGMNEDQVTTVTEQRRFLERLFQESDDLDVILVTWLLARDSLIIPERYASLSRSGLFDIADAPRPGWAVWSRASRRPLAVPIFD
ncbi:MAG TPA: hypothetical protein EYQ00_05035 [Dehalococcoidia bacterium]|nr:hypothetical protein [Dehalococcoidia bacterium]